MEHTETSLLSPPAVQKKLKAAENITDSDGVDNVTLARVLGSESLDPPILDFRKQSELLEPPSVERLKVQKLIDQEGLEVVHDKHPRIIDLTDDRNKEGLYTATAIKPTKDSKIDVCFAYSTRRRCIAVYAIGSSSAFATTSLRVADEVLSVNNVCCKGKSVFELVSLVQNMEGPVTLLAKRRWSKRKDFKVDVMKNIYDRQVFIDTSVYQPITATVVKEFAEQKTGIGFKKLDHGPFLVTRVLRKGLFGPTALLEGDEVVSANGKNSNKLNAMDLMKLFKTTESTLTLLVRREIQYEGEEVVIDFTPRPEFDANSIAASGEQVGRTRETRTSRWTLWNLLSTKQSHRRRADRNPSRAGTRRRQWSFFSRRFGERDSSFQKSYCSSQSSCYPAQHEENSYDCTVDTFVDEGTSVSQGTAAYSFWSEHDEELSLAEHTCYSLCGMSEFEDLRDDPGDYSRTPPRGKLICL